MIRCVHEASPAPPNNSRAGRTATITEAGTVHQRCDHGYAQPGRYLRSWSSFQAINSTSKEQKLGLASFLTAEAAAAQQIRFRSAGFQF